MSLVVMATIVSFECVTNANMESIGGKCIGDFGSYITRNTGLLSLAANRSRLSVRSKQTGALSWWLSATFTNKLCIQLHCSLAALRFKFDTS